MRISDEKRKKILIFSEYYLPGYKSGGGMRTIVNIVASLKDRFDFYVVTKDHDGPSDKTPYKDVKYDEWNQLAGTKVFYLHKKQIGFSKILELIRDVEPDIIYSNSYFSNINRYLLLLNKLNKFKQQSYLISPCGELSAGCMKNGFYKKKIFTFLTRIFRFHENIYWKASSEIEKNEIKKINIEPDKIFIAADLISNEIRNNGGFTSKPEKKAGSVRFVFLSRFNRKKNFKFFIKNLKNISGEVFVDIYGPIDDEKYWNECAREIENLPDNIKIEKKGAVPHSKVREILANYHFFVLPTMDENFGHVFIEALSAGCPLIISNNTPWVELEKDKIGWVIPLEKESEWRNIIQKCVDINEYEFRELSKNSKNFVHQWLNENNLEAHTIELFDSI